jgi:hypothetical protein
MTAITTGHPSASSGFTNEIIYANIKPSHIRQGNLKTYVFYQEPENIYMLRISIKPSRGIITETHFLSIGFLYQIYLAFDGHIMANYMFRKIETSLVKLYMLSLNLIIIINSHNFAFL